MRNIFKIVFIYCCLISIFNGCASKKDLARIEKNLKETEIAIREMLKDADSDGVPDYIDIEANTPAGAKVDSKGRTLDSDGDGIPDHLDKCPFVSGPASLDGCPPQDTVEEKVTQRPDQFWPIPKPTTFVTVTDKFDKINEESNLEEAFKVILEVIEKRKRAFKSILYVPNGFAVFTQLERINDNGAILNRRINIENGGCSASQMLYCLFGAPSGRYRFYGFIVTNLNQMKPEFQDLEFENINNIISNGSNYNVSYFKASNNQPIKFEGYQIHQIVYEYETYPGISPKIVSNSTIPHINQMY